LINAHQPSALGKRYVSDRLWRQQLLTGRAGCGVVSMDSYFLRTATASTAVISIRQVFNSRIVSIKNSEIYEQIKIGSI
jgi:hypothetical protein